MRSFLRGSLYGVSATSGWMNPQQQAQISAGNGLSSGSNNQYGPTANAATTTNATTNATMRGMAVQPAESSNSNKVPYHPHAATPIHFATRANYGGFPVYGANVSESETATLRAERSIRGKVSKWFDQRGFGFIEDAEGQQQYFVHARDLITVEGGQRSLFPGQTVEFEPEQTENGGHAMRVSGPGGAPLQSGPSPTAVSSTTSALPQVTTTEQQKQALPSYQQQQQEPSSEMTQQESSSVVSAEQQQQELVFPQPRLVGSIAHWTVDKGYGFVAVPGQEEHFFTHIKDFTCAKPNQSPSMPTTGMEVEFTPSFAANKKRATHVTLPNSIPFEPNVVAPPTYSAAPQQQQQQQTQHIHHPSSLALAFAVPEKKSASASLKKSSSSSQQQQQGEQQQQQAVDPMWRAGYSSGFVDGQQHLKKEIHNLPIASAPSTSSSMPKPRSQQSSPVTPLPAKQQQVITTTVVQRTNAPSSSEQQDNKQQYQQQQQMRSRSPVQQQSFNNKAGFAQQQQPRSSSTSSRYSQHSGSSNSGRIQQQQQQQPRSSSASSTFSSSNKTLDNKTVVEEIAVTAEQPKWAQQAASGWATVKTEENTTTATATTATTTTSTATTPATGGRGGFPAFPQRGGFGSLSRGRGHGGRGW